MPMIDPDYDPYGDEVEDKRSTLHMLIDDKKWIVDLVAMTTVYTALVTVFILLVTRGWNEGISPRLACGIIVTGLLICSLFDAVTESFKLCSEIILLKVRKALRVPHGIEKHNVVSHSLWRAWINMVHLTALWGTGLLFAEMIKNGSLF